ncbi:tetrathionate reductase subunit A precursor [Desulfosporosinus acididurans]|uniref:Tetrathionate reductase subunit A n=1 Tax=Desulfosporosinus acididurans TaxID=476652 RepID=A0A0J1IH38_9FIRM|nr:molybdopterin-dependent oxidoreductase [Desulfosporosinus acididurans]KLU63971.1 tetrathionate reductase subunit A precursor [Desulfosporosinus acididurans]
MAEKKDSMKLNRRNFLKASGVLGAVAFGGPFLGDPLRQLMNNAWLDTPHGVGGQDEDYTAANVIYTTCEQCNSHCTIKTCIEEGEKGRPYSSLVRKIAGNPYSPLTTIPFGPVPYGTSALSAAKGKPTLAVEGRGFRGGRTCLKGQAGIQTAYDALRVRTPLKRVGPRGSGEWKSITWEQAIQEIINGSSDLGTPGLKSLWAYVGKAKVMGDWDLVKKGQMTAQEFDRKYKDVLIDTQHPDFGPKSNQIACLGGDRRDFMRDRVWFQGFGSINFDDHGGACGANGVIGTVHSFITQQPKKRLYADLNATEFLLVWGTNPMVANRGPTFLAPMLTNALARGMKMAVIDTRMSRTAEKADLWVPILAGTDAALALGIGRWIVENKRYDERYLRNPNLKAAQADGEPTWSDATYLINVSDEKKPKLRAKDLGIGDDTEFVVLQNGTPAAHSQAAEGDLEVDSVVNGIHVKSAFTLYKERVMEQTLDEYANIAGITKEQIIELAQEFTSHGKKAAIMAYRGIAMHANGYYTARAVNMLNHLIGNHDWQGGSLTGGARHKDMTGRYDLKKVPNAHQAWGIPISRRSSAYEKSSLFKRDGYPAKRPWFPIAGNSSEEVIPSAAEGYPYSLKALFIYRVNPLLTFPAGDMTRQTLINPQKIPLLVSSDIVLSESTSCADFVLPDLSYLERWGRKTITPSFPLKVTHFMQPVTRVYPEPRDTQDVFIEILKKLGLPGAGAKAFADGSPLDRVEDFYLKMIANIAFAETPVPDASTEELQVFSEARKAALGQFFDEKSWRSAVKPEEWAKVVTVLNRGGRFEDPGAEYEGPLLKYRLNGQTIFYDEKTAGAKHSYTGQYFDGLPKYESIRTYDVQEVKQSEPLHFLNWKARNIATHRTISDVWLREIKPENFLWINPIDAKKRGLQDGDQVKIKSGLIEVVGHIMVTGGIRPGTVGTPYNYGNTAYGGHPVIIDGKSTPVLKPYNHTPFTVKKPFEQKTGYALGRDTGFSGNSLLMIDPKLKNTSLLDPIGGGVASLDTKVEIIRI